MRNKLLMLMVPTLICLASCGSTAAPAAVTSTVVTTMTPAAATVTETAVSTISMTETQTMTASATAGARNGKLTGNQAMCAYADTILNFVVAAEAGLPKDTQTAPLTFLRKVAQDSADMLSDFDHRYLTKAGITDDLNQVINQYMFGMAFFEGNAGATIADLDAQMAPVRAACKGFI